MGEFGTDDIQIGWNESSKLWVWQKDVGKPTVPALPHKYKTIEIKVAIGNFYRQTSICWFRIAFVANVMNVISPWPWRYQSYLLIGKGRITDKSPPAQLHLHVLLCLGSCCQDVIYFGVSQDMKEPLHAWSHSLARGFTVKVCLVDEQIQWNGLTNMYDARTKMLLSYVCGTVWLLMCHDVLQRGINEQQGNLCMCVYSQRWSDYVKI